MAGNLFVYLYYVIIGRIVGVEGFGVVTALLSVIYLLTVPAIIAAGVVAKVAADLHAVDDRQRLQRLANLVDRLGWITGAVACLLVISCTIPIERFFHLTSPFTVLGSAIALGASIVVTVQRSVLQGRHLFGAYAASYLLDMLSRCVLGAAGASVLGETGAIAGVAVDLLATAGFNMVAMRADLPREPARLQLKLPGFSRSVVKIGLTLLAINAMLLYDTILVRHFFSAYVAGLYSAASLVARTVYIVIGFLPVVLLPKAAQGAAAGKQSTHLLAASGLLIAVVAAFALGASVFAPGLLLRVLAGRAFTAAGPFVLPYVAALVALAAANAIANYKIGLGRFEQVGPLTLIAIAQIVVVLFRHDSVHEVLLAILIGDVCALIVSLYGVVPLPGRTQGLPARDSLA
jgi:O-antigen/teichoic acid export membrane protein